MTRIDPSSGPPAGAPSPGGRRFGGKRIAPAFVCDEGAATKASTLGVPRRFALPTVVSTASRSHRSRQAGHSCSPSAQPPLTPVGRDRRGPSSNSAHFIRHRRRFAEFLDSASLPFLGLPRQTSEAFAVGRGDTTQRVSRGVNAAARDAESVSTRRRFGEIPAMTTLRLEAETPGSVIPRNQCAHWGG